MRNFSVTDMATWFRQFNAKYFGGSLPVPNLRIGHSRTQLGSCACRRKPGPGFKILVSYTLTLSDYYDLPLPEVQSVMLHEMIHFYIAFHHLHDTAPHGEIFHQWMNRLNRDGWHIEVSHRTKDLKKNDSVSRALNPVRLVMAVELSDHEKLLSAVSPRYAASISRVIKQAPNVIHLHWYLTTDPWFLDKPRVKTPRGIRVSDELYGQLMQHMEEVKQLQSYCK